MLYHLYLQIKKLWKFKRKQVSVLNKNRFQNVFKLLWYLHLQRICMWFFGCYHIFPYKSLCADICLQLGCPENVNETFVTWCCFFWNQFASISNRKGWAKLDKQVLPANLFACTRMTIVTLTSACTQLEAP